MRIYIPHEERAKSFAYPEEMGRIMSYLSAHGVVNVPAEAIENYYQAFSEDRYCAGWMCVCNEFILAEFANWLSELEV